MVRGGLGVAFVFWVSVCFSGLTGHAATVTFELVSPIQFEESSLEYQAGFALLPELTGSIRAQGGGPAINWLPFFVSWNSGAPATIQIELLDADTLQLDLPLAPAQQDIITSDTATEASITLPDSAVYNSGAWFPQSQVRIEDRGTLGGAGLLSASWSPYAYHPLTRQLIVISRARVSISDLASASSPENESPSLPVSDALLDAVIASAESSALAQLTPSIGSEPSWHLSASLPQRVEYVVITKAAFAGAVKPLILWKARRGVSAGLATIEDISAQYAGVDQAESVREYLKAAYATGLKWVVIGGDETVAPVRRAYAEYPAYDGDVYKLQQCDLYFAELNGNWDADGDGIWGELSGDQAQMQPELYVGRLPFSTIAEAQAIVNKIIAYERGPLQTSWLTKSLSVSTDQFRDWSSGVGQHGIVAGAMPATWTHDLSSMIEAPTGSDPAPLYPDGPSFGATIAAGAGWVNYFVHGRADGFVVRSAGIMEWPRSYVLTNGSGGDGNGYLNLAPASSYAGIHLSAACDQGGFDLNSSPYTSDASESVAEKLLFMPGGAVAFVGQSRWGWVSTSFKLVQKFYEYVNNPATPNHVGIYQTLSKLAHSSFRDLCYGNNLYGDPQMPVWKNAPLALSMQSPEVFSPGLNEWSLRAMAAAGGVGGATVTIAIGDSVWALGQSGTDGSLAASVTLPVASSAILTASKSGHRVWADTLPMSIISGILDDGGDALPSSFATMSNYPNPFNSGTAITFDLPAATHVCLDVYDILGRRVSTLLDTYLDAGDHRVLFDGTNQSGHALASGVYVARLASKSHAITRLLVLVK